MKERIAEAFIELVTEQKSFKVGVMEICRKANISKPTFYKYFSDKYAVTEYIFEEEILKPMERLTAEKIKDGKIDTRGITADFYMGFYRRREFYQILIREDKQNSLVDTIVEKLVAINKVQLNQFFGNEMTETDIDYIAYRHAVLQASLLKKWMGEGMGVSPQKMADYYYFDYDKQIKHLHKFKIVK